MKRFQSRVAIVVALFALGGLAFGAISIEPTRTWFSDGLFVGPKSSNPAGTSTNRLASLCQTSATHDFGVIVDGACTQVTQDGGTATASLANCGATAIGSACMVTPPGTANDGGNQPWNASLSYRCYVSAVSGTTATATIRACKDVGDGGTVDPGPGPYRVVVLQ